MAERSLQEVREWADRLLPTPFDDEQWRVDDGVEFDPESGPYIARQPHVEDADGFEVALLFTPPQGWEVELIAAAPELARELLRLADLAEAQAAELERLRRPQVSRAKLAAVASYAIGVSPRTIARVLTGAPVPLDSENAPRDESDVRRCVFLLDAAEKAGLDWRGRLHEVAAECPPWEPLVPRWPEIEQALYDDLEAQRAAPLSEPPLPSRCWWLVSKLRGHGDPYSRMVPHPFAEAMEAAEAAMEARDE